MEFWAVMVRGFSRDSKFHSLGPSTISWTVLPLTMTSVMNYQQSKSNLYMDYSLVYLSTSRRVHYFSDFIRLLHLL